MENKIVNVGIRLTRKCNMKCTYCNIQSIEREELTLDEWKKAVDIIKRLGAKDIVILGGEPTIYPNIVELVRYISKDANLSCNLTTNAFGNFETVKDLLDAGLNSIGVSIDNLDIKESISPLKAKNGLKLIDYLLSNCEKPNITNYTVLNKKNVSSVIDLIKHMNDLGVNTYILPFHSGNEGSFEHRKNNDLYSFKTKEDLKEYNDTIDKIIKMKNEGYRVKNSTEFLENTKRHIKDLDWKCNGLSELRIDSDGRLACCCDKLGSVNEKYTIFDLEDRLDDFYKDREKDACKCKGCLWPSSFEAELKRSK